jgi:thiol:disulfide interchange protein
MARHTRSNTIAAVALIALAPLFACGDGPSGEASPEAGFETVSTHRTEKLDWEKSWDAAFTRARAEGKPVLVSFEAEWCVWCKKLESTTYRDTKVMTLIADSLVPLTLDVDGSGRELSDEHGVESLPTILVFAPDGSERGRINGYFPPGQFVEVVSEILQEG